jgi:uncharacterized OB-fold protein
VLGPHQGRALAPNEITTIAGGEVRLLGARCNDCSMKVFPITDVCPGCLSSSSSALTLGGSGRLYSYTTVHVAPPGWETPYVVGYVDLPEGVRLFGKVKADGPHALSVDMPVGVRVVADGERFRYFFEPGTG